MVYKTLLQITRVHISNHSDHKLKNYNDIIVQCMTLRNFIMYWFFFDENVTGFGYYL